MSVCTVVRAVCGPDRGSDRKFGSRVRQKEEHTIIVLKKNETKYTAKMRHTACEHKLHVLPIPHAERASAQLDSLETAAV